MAKFNFYKGGAVSAWLLVIMVILSELYSPFKGLLESLFYHHWIGKGIVTTLAFIIFGFLFRKEKASDESIAWYSVLGCLIVIFLFYLGEYFF